MEDAVCILGRGVNERSVSSSLSEPKTNPTSIKQNI